MGLKIHHIVMGAALLMGVTYNTVAFGFAPEPDLMKIKGYSPETINITQTQRNKQEWRAPHAPNMSPMERFFHNIYFNDWTGNIDEFGSQIIRNKT
jgi:hypothetical protein